MQNFSWLLNIDKFKIAMEAEDITRSTQNAVQQSIGNSVSDSETNSDNDSPDTGKSRPEEDLTKTDDIFGTEEPENTPGDTPSGNPDDDSRPEEDLSNTDNIFGDEDNQDNGETDPNMNNDSTENSIDNNMPIDSTNLDLAFADKNKIRDNMVQLYNIITGDIDLLTNSINSIDKMETVQVVNAILNHLRNAKDILYKTLTKNITKISYDELLQKYITLKRVYDLSIEMIDTYFKCDNK